MGPSTCNARLPLWAPSLTLKEGTPLAQSNGGPQGHADAQNVFAQGLDPALVLVVDIGLKTRIEHLADRLDHRIGHGDMQVAATAIQLDMEGGGDYHPDR